MKKLQSRVSNLARSKKDDAIKIANAKMICQSVRNHFINVNKNNNVMNSQGNQYPEQSNCQNCGNWCDSLMYLSCKHGFCIQCLVFSYHKHKLHLNHHNSIRCTKCQKTSQIKEEDLKAINKFTDQHLVPLMKEQSEKHNGTSKHKQSYINTNSQMSADNKQFKSHEHSLQKATPANRGFYSKCQSPKSGLNISCQIHPQQEIGIICFTCNNSLLCLSCASGKKHQSHKYKTIANGLQAFQEQISLSRLRCKGYLDTLEMTRRRLEDRRKLIQERCDKTTNTIKIQFNSLIEVINTKCNEVVQHYTDFYEKSIDEVVRDEEKINQSSKSIKRQLQKLVEIGKYEQNPIEIIKRSTQIMDEIRSNRQVEVDTGQINFCDSERIVRELAAICQNVESIQLTSHRQLYQRNGTDNYKSDEKLLKENYFKRVKTNMMSLNSSRDKKEKHCTKTQQDEKRNKSRANYKTQSSSKLVKVNKALPTYLLQHLERQNKDPQFPADLNPFQSSFKSTSKLLSKSHIPSAIDELKRKKEHTANIKERLQRKQRKTFNGSSKEVKGNTEGMKKKKIPY